MPRILATIHSEGFKCVIREEDDGRVWYDADLDVDADGDNGAVDGRAAYMVGDKGSEALANGGMAMRGGKVVGVKNWFHDIVILDEDGEPKVFPGGIIASKTSYRRPGFEPSDPAAYIDSSLVAYIVTNPIIAKLTEGAVMGCKARATNLKTGAVAEAMVGDGGPRDKNGEGSIKLCQLLGVNPSPRSGGVEEPIIRYELWPGVRSEYGYPLQLINGTHI